MMQWQSRKGFSLIEAVAVLVLISISGILLLAYTRAGLDHSARVPLRLMESCNLSGQMATIVSQNTNSLAALRQALLNDGVDAAYVTFPTNPPFEAVAGGSNLLRVVLSDAEGQRLVTLLSEP